jgi:hypothetical protein
MNNPGKHFSKAYHISYKRRNFLKTLAVLGAGTTIMPVLSSCAASQSAEDSRKVNSAGYDELTVKIRSILSYAIQAPSGHNTQPWKFRIEPNTIFIYPDYSRRLPVVDPYDRELFISLGCALENLIIAAETGGFNTSIEYDFSGKNDFIMVKLESGSPVKNIELLNAITTRQCTRNEYNKKPVPAGDLKKIEDIKNEAGVESLVVTDSSKIEKIIELVKEGNNLQMNDDAFYDELQSWIRFSGSEASEKADGLYSGCMGSPSVPRWIGKIFMNLFYGSDSQSGDDEKRIRSSSGIMLFTCRENNKLSWINTGRTYERWALTATMLNIKSAFINQPVEIPSLTSDLSSYLSPGNNIPQLLLRFGYSEAMPYSYRRSLDSCLLFKPEFL